MSPVSLKKFTQPAWTSSLSQTLGTHRPMVTKPLVSTWRPNSARLFFSKCRNVQLFDFFSNHKPFTFDHTSNLSCVYFFFPDSSEGGNASIMQCLPSPITLSPVLISRQD